MTVGSSTCLRVPCFSYNRWNLVKGHLARQQPHKSQRCVAFTSRKLEISLVCGHWFVVGVERGSFGGYGDEAA